MRGNLALIGRPPNHLSMLAPALYPTLPRLGRALLFPLLAASALLASCQRDEPPERQVEQLKADLDTVRRKLDGAEKRLLLREDESALATAEIDAAKTARAELEKALAETAAQFRAAQAELEALKKTDAFAFAEINAIQQRGQPTIALGRYGKFLQDFPNSPLTVPATAALTQLTATASAPATLSPAQKIALLDPKRRERDFQKKFNEGYMTLQELAPVLKKKSTAQVLALLGSPNQTFNSGAELGYADRAVNPATGGRGMLIIGFEAGAVAHLRVEYSGRKIVP